MPRREKTVEEQANFDFKLLQIDNKIEELENDLFYEDFPYYQDQLERRIDALKKLRAKLIKEYEGS